MTVYCHARSHQYPVAYVIKIDQKKATIKKFIANSSPYDHYNLMANCKAPHICCYLCRHRTSVASVNVFSNYQIDFPLVREIQHSFFPLHHSHKCMFLFFLFPIFLFMLISPFSSPTTPHLGPSSLLTHLLPIHILPSLFFQFPANILG